MDTLNQVTILGYVGNDPLLYRTPTGKAFSLLNIWTDESYLDSDGNKIKLIEWHRVVCWDSLAQNAAKYLNKGRQIMVRGRLRTRSFKTKDGHDRRLTEIVAQDTQYLGGVQKANNTPIDIEQQKEDMSLPI